MQSMERQMAGYMYSLVRFRSPSVLCCSSCIKECYDAVHALWCRNVDVDLEFCQSVAAIKAAIF